MSFKLFRAIMSSLDSYRAVRQQRLACANGTAFSTSLYSMRRTDAKLILTLVVERSERETLEIAFVPRGEKLYIPKEAVRTGKEVAEKFADKDVTRLSKEKIDHR